MILVYWYIILLFPHPAVFKLTIILKPILGQHYPNNCLYICLWSIANMLHQYYTIIGCQYEANANIANGNPILSQCGLTREHQCQHQYRQWETNVGPIYSCCLGSYVQIAGYRLFHTHEQVMISYWLDKVNRSIECCFPNSSTRFAWNSNGALGFPKLAWKV